MQSRIAYTGRGMSILIGSHVESKAPLIEAAKRSADVLQINLSAPVTWYSPKPRVDAGELRASVAPIYVHAPYLLNASSINPELRGKTKKALMAQVAAAAKIGAAGVVVHGGHPTGAGTTDDAVAGWVEVLSDWVPEVPVLIENTAGGKAGPTRYLEGLEKLWEAFERAGISAGYCLDTCHAHASGESLEGLVQRTLLITGKIDLVHLNDSADPAGSGRDRHANLGEGIIPAALLVEIVKSAQAPVVVETPGGWEAQARDIAWIKERL